MLTPEKLAAIESYAKNGAATPAEYAVEMVEEIKRLTNKQNGDPPNEDSREFFEARIVRLQQKLRNEAERSAHYCEMADKKSAEQVELLRKIETLKDQGAWFSRARMVLCLSYKDLRRHPDGIAAYARLVSRFADALKAADERFDAELFVKRCAEGRL